MSADLTQWERRLGRTGSYLESRFLTAFCDEAVGFGYGIGPRSADGVIGVIPQKPFGYFLLDFAIDFQFRDATLSLAVEIDGHEFHEKTREQAERDKKRERWIVAGGFRLLRFSGREVNRDAQGCAMETLEHILTLQTDFIVAAHNRAMAART